MAKEIIVFLMSATPIIEVRGAIPFGILSGVSPIKVFILSVIGSFLPAIPLLFGLDWITGILQKVPAFKRFFDWLFARTRAKSQLIEKYEALGLMLFIAVPLPGTGVWTGCLAAYLFGIRKRWSLLAAFMGTFIASLLVLFATLGLIRII